MKRVFALLLCLALMVVTFASCDVFTTVDPNASTTTPEGEQQQHTHTFSTTWSSDDEGHWYDATCDCEDAPVQKLAHADKNNDGACDVCEYAQCEHTYSEEWTIDCTNHWHAADCGHIVPGTDVAEHVDENADGKCDVCTYIIEDIHKHYYATEWSGDGEYHWHAALCEHSVEIADKAAHEIDAAGYCTVCDAKVKEIDKTDVKAVLEAAVARNNKVTGGKVEYANYIYDLVNGNLEASSSSLNEIYYTLGNGASYINWITISEWGNTSNQQWYELISLGETEEETEVFGVTTYDGGVTLEKAAGAMQHLNGYNYMPSTLLASFDSTSTLADTLLAIYTLSQAETASEVEVTYDAETGTYSIAYAYVAINNVDFTNPDDNTQTVTNVETAFFAVAALFTVDENGVVDSAAIVVDSYQDAEFDDDYNYDVATGKVEFNENAAPNRYIYSVAQTSGERTYTSAYPKASVLPTSFELSYNDELVGDSITVSAGKFNNLYLVDLVPAVSSLNFINGEIEISAVNNDAENDYTPFPYYSAGEGAVVFYSNQAGSFTLTVTYGDFVKTINVTVEPPKAESIGAYQFEMVSAWGDTWYEASIYSGITNASLNVGETLDFAVLVSPTAAAQGFTYSVDSADATITEVTLTEVMAFDEFFDTYTALQFTATAEGTYTVTLTSTEDANVTSTFTVYVGTEAPDVGGDLEGSGTMGDPYVIPSIPYTIVQQGSHDVYYVYTATEAGTVTITYPDGGLVSGLPSNAEKNEATKTWTFTILAGDVVEINPWTMRADDVEYIYDIAFVASGDTGEGGEGGEGGNTEGTGTMDNPFVIVPGDYTAEFPGGYDLIWYTMTLRTGGYITVSTDFAEPWLNLGTNPNMAASNEGVGGMSAYFPAGTTCYIGVGNWAEEAASIPFTVTFEEAISDSWNHLVGTWSASSMWGGSYTLTINADGTGTYTEDWGWGEPTENTLSYVFVDGDNVIIGYTGSWSDGSLNLVYSDNSLLDNFNGVTYTQGGSSEGGNEGDTFDNLLVLGENEIPVTVVNYWAEATTVTFTATEAGTYILAPAIGETNADVYISMGDLIENFPYEFTLAAGESISFDVCSADVMTTIEDVINLVVSKKESSGDVEASTGLEGIYSATNTWGTATISVIVTNSTISFTPPMSNTIEWTYTYADGIVTLYMDGQEVTNLLSGYFTVVDGVPSAMGYNGTDYTFDNAGEEENSEGNGTSNSPYILTETGDYVCAFPGGYDCVWYAFTPEVSGTVTLSTTFGENGWLQVGTNLMFALSSNSGSGESVSATVEAGQLCYIGVGDWAEGVAEVPFTVTFVAN